jgi:ribose 1,5-bisphosphokinase PhnN
LYILSPGKDVLRKRLTERGDSMEEIERRLTECELWDEEARNIQDPRIHFLTNDTTREEFFAQVQKILTNSSAR